jgi:hypothetical protein
MVPIEEWPGNSVCVECNFALGSLVVAVESAVIYTAVSYIIAMFAVKPIVVLPSSLLTPGQTHPSTTKCAALSIVGWILSAAGWVYWFTILSTFWNFISWIMLSGAFLVGPGLLVTYQYANSKKNTFLPRRVKLGGWLVGLLSVAAFTNVPTLPAQLQRRFDPSRHIITPEDELVLGLKDTFFQEISMDRFYTLPFDEQMNLVDDFIYQKINWKDDYSQFMLVGLLLTPHEVIQRMAGDCQGQAAVTSSLLIAMGFDAWVVETPFHWWTHAEDPITGGVHNLNIHGHAGTQGPVVPQPIDMVYSRPPSACTNCSSLDANNQNSILYVAMPHRAFMVAYTGAHIFPRSGVLFGSISFAQIILGGILYGLAVSVYVCYYQDDFTRLRFLLRLLGGVVSGVGIVLGLVFWSTYFYYVAMMHFAGLIAFSLNYLASDTFNAGIGTPHCL